MPARKGKKVVKHRGHKTHGYGSMKKNRGAGNRGGRGMAGTGKRADTKKPSVWSAKYFGKNGFHCATKKLVCGVNIADLESHYTNFVQREIIKEESGFSIINFNIIFLI